MPLSLDAEIWTVNKVQKLVTVLSPLHRKRTENFSPLLQVEQECYITEKAAFVSTLLSGRYFFCSSFKDSLKLCKHTHTQNIPKVLLENLMWGTIVLPALPLWNSRAGIRCAFLALFCPLPAILKFPLHVVLKQLGYVNHKSVGLRKHGSMRVAE